MKSFVYTEELDRLICDCCHNEDLAGEGFDLLRDREIGEEINEESGYTRLARLVQREDIGDEICIFAFGELHFIGCITASHIAIVALERLSSALAAYFMKLDK